MFVVIAVFTAVVVNNRSADPLDAAIATVADADGFGTGLEAGESFARAASYLNEAFKQCTDDHGESTRCQAIASASGYVQVTAAVVLTCTAPGRFDARARVGEYLDTVEALDDDATEIPQPPTLVTC